MCESRETASLHGACQTRSPRSHPPTYLGGPCGTSLNKKVPNIMVFIAKRSVYGVFKLGTMEVQVLYLKDHMNHEIGAACHSLFYPNRVFVDHQHFEGQVYHTGAHGTPWVWETASLVLSRSPTDQTKPEPYRLRSPELRIFRIRDYINHARPTIILYTICSIPHMYIYI